MNIRVIKEEIGIPISNTKKVTWLELFYDLIYVVAIATTTHVLAHSHHGTIPWDYVFKYVLIFIPVWWAWVGFTMYVNRYGEEHAAQRIIYFVQMVFVIVLTASINTDFESYYLSFMIGYVGIRLSTVFMYARLWLRNPKQLEIPCYLSVGFFIGAFISLNSIWFTGNFKFVILYLGIAFDIMVPLIGRKRIKRAPIHNHHLLERFGLVTLIVLGESVVSLIDTIRLTPYSLDLVIAALSGFLITIFIWWHYFESSEHGGDSQRISAGHSIIYGHLFIFLSLGILANVIRYGINLELTVQSYKILALSGFVLYALSSYFLFHFQAKREQRKSITWFTGYVAFLLMMCFLLSILPTIVSIIAVMAVFVAGSSLFLVHNLKASIFS
jgi:low temperature requirement protein LtrA